MIIGIPKEIKTNEDRVSLVPVGAETLTRLGHSVLVETKAGIGSGSGVHDGSPIDWDETGSLPRPRMQRPGSDRRHIPCWLWPLLLLLIPKYYQSFWKKIAS